ncbi:DUF2510 domain-containing protein [Miniimonas arenae]|uniref:DUF2510 domain-containing protein n=1 Tax=Miniimonas arenae TaxID=676201 RepID=UPI0015D5E8EF|nr:DUF2510 domain-containing protein [Miniimonas arenae]
MLTNDPGWYPDPQGERQVRFWDGEAWTEYVQPLAPVAVRTHGSDTAVEDYPYLADADLRASHEPRIVSTWEPEAIAIPGRARPRRRRSALGWWIAGGAVTVLVIVVALIAALVNQGPAVDPAAGPSAGSSPGVAAGQASPGSPATVSVPDGGSALVAIEVPEAGSYLLTAAAAEDVAAELSLDGTVLWSGDDRGNDLAGIIGGSWSDPAGFVQLEAGTYTLTVTEHDGVATSAEVTIYAVEAVDVAVGQTTDVTIPAGGYSVLRLTGDAEQRLAVDVRASVDWEDARLTYFPSGRATLADDRGPQAATEKGGTEYDPYLEATFPAGSSFLVLDEYDQNEITVSVAVTPV